MESRSAGRASSYDQMEESVVRCSEPPVVLGDKVPQLVGCVLRGRWCVVICWMVFLQEVELKMNQRVRRRMCVHVDDGFGNGGAIGY